MSKEQTSLITDSRKNARQAIVTAVREEKLHAIAKHPNYASQHEAYAVLLEETEETAENVKKLIKALSEYWEAVKSHDHPTIGFKLAVVEQVAHAVACEAVQVAAVVLKAQDLYEIEHIRAQLEAAPVTPAEERS
jgi:exopolyphosphatase/pppGpp-phosphohydrolase